MQPPPYPLEDAMRSRPAQSPPEVASAFVVPVSVAATDVPVVEEDIRQIMGGVIDDNESAWQTVEPKRFTKRARQLAQASPAMSGTAAKRVSAVFSHFPYVMPSSTSLDYSEHSDSSEEPTDFSVETSLPVTPSSQSVVSNQLPLTEPASIAERILSSEGRMSPAQQAYVASAVRLARMM